jgi:hypothetical protein
VYFFYCFPVERSLKVLLLLGAVPLFVLQSKTQVGETHLSLPFSATGFAALAGVQRCAGNIMAPFYGPRCVINWGKTACQLLLF